MAAVGLAITLPGGADLRLPAEPGAADDGVALELPEAGPLARDAPSDAGPFGDDGTMGGVACVVLDCLAWQTGPGVGQATQIAAGVLLGP